MGKNDFTGVELSHIKLWDDNVVYFLNIKSLDEIEIEALEKERLLEQIPANATNFVKISAEEETNLKQKLYATIGQLNQNIKKSSSIQKIKTALKASTIVFTSGTTTDTSPAETTRLKEMLDKIGFSGQNIFHIRLGEGWDKSFIYTIKNLSTINLENPTDCFLLQPSLQPPYMVILHEMLHVLLGNYQFKRKYPAFWSELPHLTHTGGPDSGLRPEQIWQRIWTNPEEVAVILGGQNQPLITENMIRYELGLPLRLLHIGGSQIAAEKEADSRYEPTVYFVSILQETLGNDYYSKWTKSLPKKKEVLEKEEAYALAKWFDIIRTNERGSIVGSGGDDSERPQKYYKPEEENENDINDWIKEQSVKS